MRVHVALVVSAILIPGIASAQAKRDSISKAYTQACYTGVAQAQKVLPDVPQRDTLFKRGYASCDGSLQRMLATGQLDKEPSMAVLGCGYAVGAMFAKYGFGDEVTPPAMSDRALKAAQTCAALLRPQGIR